MHQIKPIPLAIFQAKLAALLGLLAGFIYAFGGALIDALVSLSVLDPGLFSTHGLGYGTLMAMGALLGMPIIFAIFGFIAGLLEAIIFNLTSRWFGGISVDF